VWLQTTLNTPNISGVWQIKKWSLVSLKAHQPRQGQSPLAGFFVFVFFFWNLPSLRTDFFNIFYDLFLCSFGILLPMFQTKQKTKIFIKKKKKNNKKTCQWTLTLAWLVGFQTNKRPLFYLPNT
jgi:hypothetical protein